MHRLHLLGLNHTTAPLDVRERLAFSPARRAAATADFVRAFPDSEAVILSTCNRVEVYTARAPRGQPGAEDVAAFFATFHGVDAGSFRPHLYHRSGPEHGRTPVQSGVVVGFDGAGGDADFGDRCARRTTPPARPGRWDRC